MTATEPTMAEIFDLLERRFGGRAAAIVRLRAFVDWLGQQLPEDSSDPWAVALRRPDVAVTFVDDLEGCNALVERHAGPRHRVLLPDTANGQCELTSTELLAHELGHVDLNLFPAWSDESREAVAERERTVDLYAAERYGQPRLAERQTIPV